MVRYCRLLNDFKTFSCKIRDPHVFSHSSIKVTEDLFVISNLAVTKRIAINYSRADFSLKWISESLHLDLKITFNLQYDKFLSEVLLSLALKSTETLPKYGKTQINSLLGNLKLRSLWIYSLVKNFFIRWLTRS